MVLWQVNMISRLYKKMKMVIVKNRTNFQLVLSLFITPVQSSIMDYEFI